MSSSTTEATVDVVMPAMGVSVSEGTLVEWKVGVGEPIAYEAPICEIATDKIDTELPSPAAGIVSELLVEVGETVSVGTVLARIAVEGGVATPGVGGEVAAPAPAGSEAAAATGESPAPATSSPAPAPAAASARRYSPVVSRIAAEHGVDLDALTGSGRGGRVTKKDVLAALDGGATATEDPPLHIESPYRPDPEPPQFEPKAAAIAPSPPPPPPPPGDLGGRAEPLSRMRQVIGRAMVDSLQTAATCTTVAECDMSAVERARAALGVTYLPIVARATIDALREFPQLNATLADDVLTTWEDRVHLGIAVSLGQGGLIVPVIHDAQELSPEGLAARIKDLARRAREGGLSNDDLRGATFTITNPGPFGSILATPVINRPQVAILDTEAVVKRPVVVTDEHGSDAIAIRPMTYLCMSWDHRALDGALAARFLASLRARLESYPLR